MISRSLKAFLHQDEVRTERMGQGRDVVTKNFPFQHGAVEEAMRGGAVATINIPLQHQAGAERI